MSCIISPCPLWSAAGLCFLFFLLHANTDFKIRFLKCSMKLNPFLLYAFYEIGNGPLVMAEVGMTICYMTATHLQLCGLTGLLSRNCPPFFLNNFLWIRISSKFLNKFCQAVCNILWSATVWIIPLQALVQPSLIVHQHHLSSGVFQVLHSPSVYQS